MKTNGLRNKKPAMARACARCGKRARRKFNWLFRMVYEDGFMENNFTVERLAINWHRAAGKRYGIDLNKEPRE